MSGGFYQMHREWMDNPALGGLREKYCRRAAWCWLIENAAWKPRTVAIGGRRVELLRGQLTASTRFLAKAWKWSEPAVRRFVERLKTEAMIGVETDAGQMVITICNYNKYQAPTGATDAASDAASDAEVTQGRRKSKNGRKEKQKEEKEKESGAPAPNEVSGKFYFNGSVIRLSEKHWSEWQNLFVNIPNLKALLVDRDCWLSGCPEAKRRNWFLSTQAWLANKDADFALKAKANGGARKTAPRQSGPNVRDLMRQEEERLRAAVAAGEISEADAARMHGSRGWPPHSAEPMSGT